MVVVVVLVLVVGSGGLSCPFLFLFLFPSVFLSPISYISRLFLTVYLNSLQKKQSSVASSVTSSIKKGGWKWLIHKIRYMYLYLLLYHPYLTSKLLEG